MRFSAKIASLLCAALILAPFAVDAAGTTLKLKDIIAIVQSNKKPLAFDVAVKGAMNDLSATLSVKGTQNGNMKSLAKAAADMTFVLDAQADATTSGHAELHGIIVNKTAYVRLEKFTVTGDWAEYGELAEPYEGLWFSMPIDADQYAEYISQQENGRRTSLKEIEAFFSVATEQLAGNKTRYTVTIPKNKQRRLLAKILGRGNTAYLRSTTIDVSVVVETMKNIFDATNGRVAVTTSVEGESATFSLTGKTNALKTMPTIVAPSGSTPWEAFLQE